MTPPATPDAWDIRTGKSINGVAGKLKTNCRNLANTTLWDAGLPKAVTVTTGIPGTLNATAHGYANDLKLRLSYTSTAPSPLNSFTDYFVVNAAADTFQLSSTQGGAAIDITATGVTVFVYRVAEGTLSGFDTIDDYNNGGSILTQTPWAPANACGGVEAVAGDDNVWKDMTSGTCDGAGKDCRFLDKISGLEWTETAASTMNWGQAVAHCESLSFDGVSSGWRLPTQKELMNAYEHGIFSAANANWITTTQMFGYFWSSSTLSVGTGSAWIVLLSYGSRTTTTRTLRFKSSAFAEFGASGARGSYLS